MDILSLRYAPAEELTVFKEVSTSLSGYSSLRIRQEVSLPVRSLFLRPDLVKKPSVRTRTPLKQSFDTLQLKLN